MVIINLPVLLVKQKYYHNIQKTKIELNKLRIKKEKLDKDIEDCLSNIEKNEYAKHSKKCSELESDIHILEAKKRDSEFKEGKANPFKEALEENNKSKIKKDPIKEECKELFNKIAKLTHPDVAKTPDLIPLFGEAKEAYFILDYIELQRIYNLITNPNIQNKINIINETSEEELQKEYQFLVEELKKEQIELAKILQSVQYKIFSLSESKDEIDNMISDKLFLDVIMSKIMMLKRKREQLEKCMK